MTLEPSVLSVIVPAATAIAVLITRQVFASRQIIREAERQRVEQWRQAHDQETKLSGERETDRVELVLREWQKQLDWALKRAEMSDTRAVEAVAREEQCERRCAEMETRIDQMGLEIEQLRAALKAKQ